MKQKKTAFFSLKIPVVRYLGGFTFYIISMAQSGSKNFKCVYFGGEESCDPQQRKLCSRRAHEEKLNGFTNTVCGTHRAMNISWLLKNNNLFGSFENKPSGYFKKCYEIKAVQ